MKLIGNIIVVFGTLVATASANAAAVNVVTDNTVPAMAASVLPVPVLGSDMVGMEATVTFSDGSTDTGSWGPTGATSGVAFGAGGFFVVGTANDTFTSTWVLDNLNSLTITRLTFNGVPGNTVFDIIPGATLTPDSSLGFSFVDLTNLPGTIDVTYSNPVGIGAAAPLNDLYATMDIDFSGLQAGGVTPGTGYDFQQDTDMVQDLRVPPPQVPLPATLPLTRAAFVGLGAWSRRR